MYHFDHFDQYGMNQEVRKFGIIKQMQSETN